MKTSAVSFTAIVATACFLSTLLATTSAIPVSIQSTDAARVPTPHNEINSLPFGDPSLQLLAPRLLDFFHGEEDDSSFPKLTSEVTVQQLIIEGICLYDSQLGDDYEEVKLALLHINHYHGELTEKFKNPTSWNNDWIRTSASYLAMFQNYLRLSQKKPKSTPQKFLKRSRGVAAAVNEYLVNVNKELSKPTFSEKERMQEFKIVTDKLIKWYNDIYVEKSTAFVNVQDVLSQSESSSGNGGTDPKSSGDSRGSSADSWKTAQEEISLTVDLFPNVSRLGAVEGAPDHGVP
ncbi:hypothetical protein H0H93_002185 [Arthromyces matolae]|nr:hypothetical protein H0H93_002185 [Arthromyces matolae]